MDFGSPPFEGSGGLRIGGDESVNRGAQLPYVTEASSLQGSAGEQTEPDFDLIEPRSMGGSEVEVDVGMPRQPAIMLGLVGAQIVQDHWLARHPKIGRAHV